MHAEPGSFYALRCKLISSNIGLYLLLLSVRSNILTSTFAMQIPVCIPVLLGFFAHLLFRWDFLRRCRTETTLSWRRAWLALTACWLPLAGAVSFTDSWCVTLLVLGSAAIGAIAGYASCADTLQRLRNNTHIQAETLALQVRVVKMYGTYFGSIVAYTMSAVFLLAYGTLGKTLAL